MTHTTQNSTSMKDMIWSACLAVAFGAAMLLPDMAMAGSSPMADTLCAILEWFQGTTGRALATLAIIIIGVGALMGKVSWGMAIIVALGIAIVFGAPTILGALDSSGGGSAGC